MKYLLDTNICIYLIKKKHPEVIERLIRAGLDRVAVSAVTLAELEYGVANSSRRLEAQTALLEFILPFEILDFDSASASHYGNIRKELKDKGRLIGDMDMLIASIAMANGLIVVTNNEREFQRIPGLKIENWKG
ncbi:MAG: type II toxin-antitoxin system VapC family toxin [Fibrobacterota bacterium]